MRFRPKTFLLALLCAGCAAPPQTMPPAGPVAAAKPPGSATINLGDQGPEAAQDMALLYQRVCLLAFPDEAASLAELQQLGAVPLDPAQVAVLLRPDPGPGQGWRVNTPLARYVVTIEAPPFHTCAIRRITRFGLPTAQPYIAALRSYADAHGLVLGRALVGHSKTPQGSDMQVIGTPIFAADRPVPGDTSIYLSTDLHGHFNPIASPEAVGGTGVEVRMAHQIKVPQPNPRNAT